MDKKTKSIIEMLKHIDDEYIKDLILSFLIEYINSAAEE